MFKILDDVCTPTKGSEFSACIDLYARNDVVIGAGQTVLVPLGVKIDLIRLKYELQKESDGLIFTEYDLQSFMKWHQLNLHIRSSMSSKHGLIIANGTGVIDLDYEDEIMICLHNPQTYVGARWLNHKDQCCPKCGQYQIDDCDGINLDKEIGNVFCPECQTDFVYVKNFRPIPDDFSYHDCEREWIDTSYEESKSYNIKKGDKIAQINLVEHKTYLLGVKSEDKRNGGFGSTGK